MNIDTDNESYIAPKIVDYGSVQEMTAGRSNRIEGDYLAGPGKSSITGTTTGACIGHGLPCGP